MDGSMLSKSLIQFSVNGWGCVPSLLFDLRPNYVPGPCGRPPWTQASARDSWTLTGKSGSGVCSSSPARTPKLQLTAEQLLAGDCWILPKKETSCPRAKEQPQQDDRRGEILFRIKTHTHQRHSEGSNKMLCAQGDPTKTEPGLPLSV